MGVITIGKLLQPVGGSKTVTASGTGVPLSATSVLARWLYVRAKAANTQSICLGDSTVDKTSSRQLTLAASAAVTIAPLDGDVVDLASVYIDADVNGEGVDFLYLKAV